MEGSFDISVVLGFLVHYVCVLCLARSCRGAPSGVLMIVIVSAVKSYLVSFCTSVSEPQGAPHAFISRLTQ